VRSSLPGAGGHDEPSQGAKAMQDKGGSKTRAGARGNEKSYRSSLLEIGRVGYFFRRIHQIEKGSQANRRKGEELSIIERGCTQAGPHLSEVVWGIAR